MLQADLGFIDQFIFFCQIRVGTPNSGYMDHVCPGLNGPYKQNVHKTEGHITEILE